VAHCVVSVDFATRRARDVGVCVLTQRTSEVHAELVALGSLGVADPPEPARVAQALAVLARSRGARLLLIDGCQAWKDPANGLAHARVCERALHTPAKTGERGRVKPRTYTAFVAQSIALFDALHALGWPRLETDRGPRRRCAVEAFPHAAWKRLGLAPLPAKAKCAPVALAAATRALRRRCHVRIDRAPNHDELQALAAGIAGLAWLARDRAGYELLGAPPTFADGHWREGYVLAPRAQSF
jgi:hypothetical protein